MRYGEFLNFLNPAATLLSALPAAGCGRTTGNTVSQPNDTPLKLQNQFDGTDVITRSYYPHFETIVLKLEAIRSAADLLTDTQLTSELRAVMREAEQLGIYYDYHNHTYYTGNDGTRYGASDADGHIGGGQGYVSGIADGVFYTASCDTTLKIALSMAAPGDIIFIKGNVVIDLADFIQAGDTVGFQGERIPYKFIVPTGVTLASDRGTDGSGGAILKVSSYADIALTLGTGARLSGLVIQGPDMTSDAGTDSENLSNGIRITGDGAIIDNCELSGFYGTGIVIENAADVTVKNCYIHHICGLNGGVAFDIDESGVTVTGCLFSNITTLADLSGIFTTVSFRNNIDAGNIAGNYFVLGGDNGLTDIDYPTLQKGIASFICENNTLLSMAEIVSLKAVPSESCRIENNLFAYAETVCGFDAPAVLGGLDGSVYADRITMKNNVFDVREPFLLSKSSDALQSATARLGAYSNLIEILQPFELAIKPAETVIYKEMPRLTVLSGSFYPERDDKAFVMLRELLNGEREELDGALKGIVDTICTYTNYTTYLEKNAISVEVDGEIYGAYSDGDSLGGGEGYSEIYTTGDYIVTSVAELKDAVGRAKAGEVIFILSGVRINLGLAKEARVNTITIPSGVTLAGDRGTVLEDGSISTGAVICSNALSSAALLESGGDNVRITGLTIEGADASPHQAHWKRAFSGSGALGSKYYYCLKTSRGIAYDYDNLTIDNCEISGFVCGIFRKSKSNGNTVRGIKIHHNYIHHCQVNGLGYGVAIGHAYADIYCNLFNYNRHSIAGSGHADSGYKAWSNVNFGQSLDHYFDMHSGIDRRDGTDIAAEYVEISNNTFLGKQTPYSMRGLSTDHQTFDKNIVYLNYSSYSRSKLLNPSMTVGKNIWDYSSGNLEVTDGLPE